MSLIVLACDPSNLQIVNGLAECSQWIAVEHTTSFFDVFASASPLERQHFKQAVASLIISVVVGWLAVVVLRRF